MTTFDYAVLGKGLIGSAAARYLSVGKRRVVIVGPDEPTRPAAHQGVFASHYDQGRITRLIGRDSVYSKLAELAIEQYATLERDSGIQFHFPVGMLIVDAPHVPDGHMKNPLRNARALGRRFTHYPAADRSWREPFPYFDFPDGYSVVHEPAPAGYINPRDLIRAELSIGTRDGMTIVRETATRVRRAGRSFAIETDQCRIIDARHVVVAAGAFTNCFELVPRELAFQPETESILLAGVSEEDGQRFANAPTVIYLIDDPEIWDIYMTPPIRYPDGRFYVKLGANSVHDRRLSSLEELGAWFRNGNSDDSKDAMTRALRSLWPALELTSLETKRCILCRTPNGYPVIDEIDDGLFVAAGGNGGSAKCSDALGRLTRNVALREPWPRDIPRELFRAQYS